MYNRGDKVLFIDGDHKDKFGTYVHRDYDSGYYIPFVELDNGIIVRPWDKEIVSLIGLKSTRERLSKEINICAEIISHWNELEDKL